MSAEPQTVLPEVPPPHAPDALVHASAMVDRPGLLMRFFGRFFEQVELRESDAERILDAESDGPVVLVLERRSILDFLYLNWVFLNRDLPLAAWSSGMRTWPFRAAADVFRRLRQWVSGRRAPASQQCIQRALQCGEPILVFARRRQRSRWYRRTRRIDPLESVVRACTEVDGVVRFVPVVIAWQRVPTQLRRGVLDRFFGSHESPGRLRELLNFMGNHSHALVRVGDPMELRSLVAPKDTDERAASKIRYSLNRYFINENRVIRGPTGKTAAETRAEMLRPEGFGRHLPAIAEQVGEPLPVVRKRADKYLREIVSDVRHAWIEAARILLVFVFNKIYAGVEVRGIQKVLDASREAPLVVTPSHKSHIDYLLLSYLFYDNGLVPPNIAAGNNLNFFPLGHIFRRWGAFFLRRSFRQNPLYAQIFRAYVHKLLKDGHTVEFFIEGGRSRTGKLLPPKYGLLGHVVDAVVEGITRDVMMVPTAIGYEKIIEGRAYVRELSGQEKTGENLSGLLGAVKVLSERFGRVYVSFDAPMSLRGFLESHGVHPDEGFEDAAHRRAVITKLGYRILGGINHVSPATASSIVATAMLNDRHRGLSDARLLDRVGGIVDFLLLRRAPLSDGLRRALSVRRLDIERARDDSRPADVAALVALSGESERARIIGDALKGVVDEIVDVYRTTGWIAVREFDRDEVYAVPDDARVQLDYYRSGLSHHMVADAILACAAMRCAKADDLFGDRLRAEARFLSELLRLEFVFPPGHSFDEQYLHSLDVFQQAELIVPERAGRFDISGRQLGVLRWLARTVDHFIEGYRLVVDGALELEVEHDEKAFSSMLLRRGVRAWHEGEVRHREAVNSVLLKNATGWLIDGGYVVRRYEEQGRKTKRFLSLPEDRERRRELRQLRAKLSAYGGA